MNEDEIQKIIRESECKVNYYSSYIYLVGQLKSGQFISVKELRAKRLLSCTLCKQDLHIHELETHYNTNHVGTYSPFAWIEQFVRVALLDEMQNLPKSQEKIET